MKIIVTNRKLCTINFLDKIEQCASENPCRIILREKDLSYDEYSKLYFKCKNICDKYNIPLFVHSFFDFALDNNIKNVHLPFNLFKENISKLNNITKGVSIHSIDEAVTAQNLGADYIIAGHIFATDCKKNIAPRGLGFLEDIVKSVNIPVFAIGGINDENKHLIYEKNAKGYCIMSSAMK